MKHWKILIVLLAFVLCACARREPARAPETPAPENERIPLWSELDWSGHLELDYAQSFAVDFSSEGYARISIDQETYLLTPQLGQPPAEVPEDVTVLRQPLENIYLQATAAMDCFRQL